MASCLDMVNIKETRIIDDQTILFETYGGTVYINRLPAFCSNLFIAGAFSYETSLDRLCKHDIIAVVEKDASLGSRCGLGKYIQIKGVKRIRDAVKILVKDGVLKDLVEEGVFEEVFPRKKDK